MSPMPTAPRPSRVYIRRVQGPLLLALTVALAGCVSTPPPRTDAIAAQALPAQWPADTAADGTSAALPDWETYFADPQLRQLIQTALDHNHDLRLAVLRMQEAQAAFRIQRADQWPMLGVSAQQARVGVPDDVQPLINGQSVLEDDSVSAGISSWELDLWGRVRHLKKAALETWLSTDEAQRAVRVSLIAQVANAYLSLRETDERIALTERTIATREKSFALFKRREEVGSISRLDLSQVETLLLQARATGSQLHQSRASQAHALDQLLGAPSPLPTPLPPDGGTHPLAALPAGLPSDLLARRPDLIAAEHQLLAAHANVDAARADYFPRISLTGMYGTASTDLDNLFEGGSGAWLFRPTISLPIFDAGKRRANVRMKQVREDTAVAQYEQSVQQAFREVSDALSAHRWLGEQVDIADRSVVVLGERARLATLRYDAGSSNYLDVLDAERDLLSAQQQKISARRALASSQVSLYAALGGGATGATSSESPSAR